MILRSDFRGDNFEVAVVAALTVGRSSLTSCDGIAWHSAFLLLERWLVTSGKYGIMELGGRHMLIISAGY